MGLRTVYSCFARPSLPWRVPPCSAGNGVAGGATPAPPSARARCSSLLEREAACAPASAPCPVARTVGTTSTVGAGESVVEAWRCSCAYASAAGRMAASCRDIT